MKVKNKKFFCIVLFLIGSVVTSLSSWSQPKGSQYSKNKILEIRNAMNESAKTYCVGFWTESDKKQQALYRSGISLSAQCGCTQQEVNYIMTDELAIGAYDGFDDLESGKPVPIALEKWHKLVFNSMQLCSEKLMRRR